MTTNEEEKERMFSTSEVVIGHQSIKLNHRLLARVMPTDDSNPTAIGVSVGVVVFLLIIRYFRRWRNAGGMAQGENIVE